MFWKVAGFSQPSTIELILDRDEFTLEMLLDEDDLIQECKSLNGRLVAFLRERSTVEQLVRYLVGPPRDPDDPKCTYKYPFTSCEVFCCEVEAVFNTLLEDAELMKQLFSLLDSPAPLNSKTAGYFGRVVGTLLLRKTNEMMQYLQDNSELLDKLVTHVDTTSIAEIIKRLVGADEQSSILFLPQYAQWLSETHLVENLLSRLAQGSSAEAQANAADILSAIAHTQPSPLASKLTKDASISQLFTHAMAPGRQVLVPALDVCIALIEPRRSAQVLEDGPLHQDAAYKSKVEAVDAIIQHLPVLVDLLANPGQAAAGTPSTQETPYGLLAPPLGRARLKVVELLAVLLRSGSSAAEAAVIQSGVVAQCLSLFATYPFNNLLHHCVLAMLVAGLTKNSDSMLAHLFEQCKLLEWIIGLPIDVRPTPRPGHEEAAAAKLAIRAGYMGHVTQLASTLESFSSQPTSSSSSDAPANAGASEGGAGSGSKVSVANYLEAHAGWHKYVDEVLHPRIELENTARWACGRPTATELAGLDSDGEEFQAEMELESMVGMQPALYHRYNVDENDEEDDDDDDDHEEHYKASVFGAQAITDAISNIDLNDSNPWHQQQMHDENTHAEGDDDKEGSGTSPSQGQSASGAAASTQSMEDDEVLLASSDDEVLLAEGESEAMTEGNGPTQEGAGVNQGQQGSAEDTQDMVIVEEAEAGSQQSSQQQQGSKSPQAAGKEGGLDRLWHASAAQPALVQEDA